MKHRKGIYMKTAKQYKKGEESEEESSTTESGNVSEVWLPETNTAFRLLMSANLCSALMNNISDCDETYNYWEPLHHLLYGEGMQTWEYSPEYAIRSWAYIFLHSILTWPTFGFITSNKLMVFYFIRMIFGVVTTLCEVHFYRGVALRFGNNVARLVLAFLVLGTGMFISATAFLPSTFCMYGTFLFVGCWFQGDLHLALLCVAASAIVAWPFSVALGIPLAVDICIRRKKYAFFLKWVMIALATMLFPCFLIDSHYYGKPVVASLNILLYNVFTDHGPDIYGTEPLSYYLLNGFLNFNIVFVLALMTIIVVPLAEFIVGLKYEGYRPPMLLVSFAISPMYIWIAIFFTQPHKEERFLFPIYPLICLAAAVTVATVQKLYCVLKLNERLNVQWISVATIFVYTILSLSRTAALFQSYHGSMEIYPKLHLEATRINVEKNKVSVCVGKEWHRFPSSFLLPTNFTLEFIQSEFKGQLPQHFHSSGVEGTTKVQQNFNEQNLEEKSRYVDIKTCHFLIDYKNAISTKLEPVYSDDVKSWEIIEEINYLEASKSKSRFFRAFYVPFYFSSENVFGKYQLLQSKRKLPKYYKS